MTLNPHLSFDGRCESAFHFYQRCLGGKVDMLTWGDSPMASEVPPEWRGKICHATLTVGTNQIMGCDVQPGQYEPPKGFQILLGVDDLAEAERTFQALAENGSVQMPMQRTFWAARFGVLTDQFGVSWSINGGEAH